jgi:hypothetical protein
MADSRKRSFTEPLPRPMQPLRMPTRRLGLRCGTRRVLRSRRLPQVQNPQQLPGPHGSTMSVGGVQLFTKKLFAKQSHHEQVPL